MSWLAEEIPESQWADLARFLVTNYLKPTGSSDLAPRWMIICWFISQAKDLHNLSAIKSSLTFDLMFFKDTDSIFLIEPFFQAMVNSIKNYVDISEELLEFLFMSISNFDTKFGTYISQSVAEAFALAETNNLIPNLDVLIKEE
jgi:hypothetical protein